MSTLEHLTAKILSDSEAKAEEVRQAARAEADRLLAAAADDAAREKAKLLADAKIQAQRQAEQIVVGKTLAVRDQNLGAKQQMLDKVFALALERLNAMSREDYLKYLVDTLAAMDLDGEEIVLPKKYGVTDIGDINAALQKAGKKGNLTLAADQDIEGGFILRKGGIEQNNTFEALVGYYRYELESEVIQTLY